MHSKRGAMNKALRITAQLPQANLRAAGTRSCATVITVLLTSLILLNGADAQTSEKPDLSKDPTLYVVGYAHLDTEWRWEYPQVINEYLRKPMEDNFTLFEQYPHSVFNFTCSNPYPSINHYYPHHL